MKSVSQTASKTVISYIHKLIQTNKFSHLIALIYDNILENSEKSFLNKAQTEIILSLLRLPNKQVPNIVSYADLCSLLKDAYDEKIGNLSDKNEEIISKSENNWDQGNLEELEVLSTLNSLRNKTHTQCPDIFNFIRQENLIRTVMRQACRLQRLKEELFEMEQKMNCLVAHYVAEKYCACQKGEYSECDSGCHTDRSSSSNNSITKLFVIKKEDINDSSMNACQDFLTTNNGHKHSGTDSHKKVVKLLNEFGKSLYDAHTYINDPCTSAFARDDGQSSNDFALSINQISEDMIMNEATMISSSTIDSQSKKSMNARSNITLNPLKVKLTTMNSLPNESIKIMNQNNDESMCMTHSLIGTEMLSNFRRKFTKLKLTTDFGCYDYDNYDQILCKKIELKRYIEFDTSSFWRKK